MRHIDEGLRIYELEALLAWMQRDGSGLVLDWGEDTGQWECSWIVGGRRVVGHGPDPYRAAQRAIRSLADAAANSPLS